MKTNRRWHGLLLAFLFGTVVAGIVSSAIFPRRPARSVEQEVHEHDRDTTHAETDTKRYMCPMMCVEPQPEPGRCPVCGMDLVPMPQEGGAASGAGQRLTLSESARKLAEVRTRPVERRFARIELRLSGKVEFDETRVREISAWVPGRLERVYVDQTGTRVREGDPLVEIYSPELNAEKASYLATLRSDRVGYGSDADEDPEEWIARARARLRLRGMTLEQIKALEERDAPGYTDTIVAPLAGTVIHKTAMAGMHVRKGQRLYTVADLTRVWVWLDAYESDIPFLRYAQRVEIRTESYGDRPFHGWVSFIDPVLDPQTRTSRVRVIVDNADRRLKPHMFVRARIAVRVGEDGAVLPGENVSDKWISPRHPEILRDEPGDCPVCGIDLVRAETLGYATGGGARPPLLVPASAVLYTGPRSLVYRRVPRQEKPTYEPVTVRLGPRVNEAYVVLEGLAEGDEVVVHGAFKIDAALQLGGEPSMMRPAPSATEETIPDEADATPGEDPADAPPAAVRAALAEVMHAYFAIQRALGRDSPEEAKREAAALQEALLAVPLEPLGEARTEAWTRYGIGAYKSGGAIAEASDLAAQRMPFRNLSASMEALVKRFGPLPGVTAYRAYCPMAFDDEGAYWLQETETILNPYEGSRMPHCGSIEARLAEEGR